MDTMVHQKSEKTKVYYYIIMRYGRPGTWGYVLIEDMAYRPHVEHSPAAREAAKSFKATEVWWSR